MDIQALLSPAGTRSAKGSADTHGSDGGCETDFASALNALRDGTPAPLMEGRLGAMPPAAPLSIPDLDPEVHLGTQHQDADGKHYLINPDPMIAMLAPIPPVWSAGDGTSTQTAEDGTGDIMSNPQSFLGAGIPAAAEEPETLSLARMSGQAMAPILDNATTKPRDPATPLQGADGALVLPVPTERGGASSFTDPTFHSATANVPAITTSGTTPAHLAGPGSTTITATLSTPVGQPGWGQELSQQLTLVQQRGEHRMDLHLHPTELGPLSVSLKVDEQGAQAQFFSAHGQVRQALEQALPQLREALAQLGISLAEASVNDQQHGGQQQRDTFGGQAVASSIPTTETAQETPTASHTEAVSNGVDVYA